MHAHVSFQFVLYALYRSKAGFSGRVGSLIFLFCDPVTSKVTSRMAQHVIPLAP